MIVGKEPLIIGELGNTILANQPRPIIWNPFNPTRNRELAPFSSVICSDRKNGEPVMLSASALLRKAKGPGTPFCDRHFADRNRHKTPRLEYTNIRLGTLMQTIVGGIKTSATRTM